MARKAYVLFDIRWTTGLVGLFMSSWERTDKLHPPRPILLGTQASNANAFWAWNADFAFVKARLSRGSCPNA